MTAHVLYGSFTSPTQIQNVVVEGVRIDRGRQDFTSAVSSNRASFRIVYDSSAGTFDPTTLELGKYVQIQYFTPAGYNLFGGVVTDLSFDKDTAQVTAVSDGLSRLGRATFDLPGLSGTVWQTLGDLYNLFLTPLYRNLGPPGLVFSVNPNELVSIAAVTDASPISVLQQLAASAPNSFLFEGLSGQLTLYDESYFRPSTWPVAPVTLNADEIVDDWSATKTIGEKVNRAEVTYNSGTVADEDLLDQDDFGVFSANVTTFLTGLSDAEQIAERTLANFADPGWQISALTIPVHTLSTARQNVVTALGVGQLVDIPELYPGLPTRYVVQGISDNLGQIRFERTLYLADWTLFRPAQAWNDVDAALEWQDVDVSVTWADLVRDWI